MKSKSSGTFPADHMCQLIIHTASPKMDMSTCNNTRGKISSLPTNTLDWGDDKLGNILINSPAVLCSNFLLVAQLVGKLINGGALR